MFLFIWSSSPDLLKALEIWSREKLWSQQLNVCSQTWREVRWSGTPQRCQGHTEVLFRSYSAKLVEPATFSGTSCGVFRVPWHPETSNPKSAPDRGPGGSSSVTRHCSTYDRPIWKKLMYVFHSHVVLSSFQLLPWGDSPYFERLSWFCTTLDRGR